MKVKRILASILCIAMVLSTMGVTVFASEAPKGDIQVAYFTANYNNEGRYGIFGEAKEVVGTESFKVELYSGDTIVGAAELVDTDKALLNGQSKKISWHILLGEDNDSWWKTSWVDGAMNVNALPDKVKLYVDGAMVSEGTVKLNSADNSYPVIAVVNDKEGNVKSFVTANGYVNNMRDITAKLSEAINSDGTENGDTVTLLRNITLDKTLRINAGTEVILDLNGKTIDFAEEWVYGAANSGTAVITVDFGGDLTVEDFSTAKTGTINGYDPEAENADGAYRVYGAVMMTASGDDSANGTAKLTVNSGTLLGTFAGIGGNRNRDNTEIVINGGTIKCGVNENYASVGIDHPQNGKLIINGGHIEGMDGISLRSGTLVIKDGTIVGTAPESTFENEIGGGNYWDNNFGTCTGHALQIVSRANNEATQETPSVTVKGGSFSAAETDAVGSYASEKGTTPDTKIVGFISGGTFSSDVTALCADGCKAVLNEDGTYTVKEYSVWTTDSDAGFYLSGNTKYGLMRFLFKADIVDTVTRVGIKYINGKDIAQNINGDTAKGAEPVTLSGDYKSFYGDIINIPDTVTEGTYYAAAFIETANGIVWSNIVDCSINWNQQFTNYQPKAAGGAK